MPLHNRFEALDLEEEVGEEVVPSLPTRSHRKRRLTSQLKTASDKKERRVIVIGNSLLKGTEGPICRVDPHLREVCSLPGARIKDIARELPRLVHPTDYYPLLVFQTDGEEAASRSLRGMKNDFKVLGRMVKDSGAQVIFSSLLPSSSDDVGWNRKIQSLNGWLQDWCYRQGFGFFDNGWFYKTPVQTVSRGKDLSRRGKRMLGQELAGLIWRALN